MKLTAALLTGACLAGSLYAQGSLTPPGAPSPNMKTLTQVEPRSPLEAGTPGVVVTTNGTMIITLGGSYYLTDNLAVSSGDGIQIAANGVTLDLNGYSISSSANPSSDGSAIRIQGNNVSVFNGFITSGTIYFGGEGDQYTGTGFLYGIYADDGDYSTSYTGIRIYDISLRGLDQDGIYLDGWDSLVRDCTVYTAGAKGIYAGEITHCTAIYCGDDAIYSQGSVNGCVGYSTGGYGIGGKVVADSYGYADTTQSYCYGIYAVRSVANSYGFSKGASAIYADVISGSYGLSTSENIGSSGLSSDHTVQNSTGISKDGSGIYAGYAVINSYGESQTTNTSVYAPGISSVGTVQCSYGKSLVNDGISAGSVNNSIGITQSGNVQADGIEADKSVVGSYGTASAGNGINSRGNIIGSYGISTGNTAVYSRGMVINTYGKSTSTNALSDGINALFGVQSSYGLTSGGTGIMVGGNVLNSYGATSSTNSSSDGIHSSGNVQNCYGSSEAGEGIYGHNAADCYGTCNGSGDGVHANYTVHNCYGYSYSGNGVYSKSVEACYGASYSGTGISANTVLNSTGRSFTGTDISANIANSCYCSGTVSITHKYNMP